MHVFISMSYPNHLNNEIENLNHLDDDLQLTIVVVVVVVVDDDSVNV